jgi:hypothetical protein
LPRKHYRLNYEYSYTMPNFIYTLFLALEWGLVLYFRGIA